MKKCEKLNEFTARAPWVNVNPDSIKEIQHNDNSFKQTVTDFMNHTTLSRTSSKQIWREKKEIDLGVLNVWC